MEPFKERLGAEAVRGIARAQVRVDPAFPEARFVAEALAGLEALELKGRVRHIAAALRRALPADWPRALERLLAPLPPPLPDARGTMSAFALWPLLQVVEEHGLEHPELSLAALRELTRRFSAEFAVRPYLEQHPALAWAHLRRWAADEDQHVRRLASEGSRPRLPWGRRLEASVRDPSPGLALIEGLADDPSPYVRRSVANHLGDVAKDHPALALRTARRWLAERPEREALVRHALRLPLKAGDPEALALFGHHPPRLRLLRASLRPTAPRLGETVEVVAELRALEASHARIDIVWSWPGARGGWSRRAFRGADRRLREGEVWTFTWRLPLRPVSTRPLRPGEHRLQLRISGEDQPPLSFVLEAAGGEGRA